MLDALLDAAIADVQGLNLALNSVPVRTVKRKGTKSQPDEGIDDPTQITVCQSEEEERLLYIAFGRPPTTEWSLEIGIVSPNNRDWSTNLSAYGQWREQIRALFSPPAVFTTALWSVPGVWEIRPEPREFLNRGDMVEGRDNQTVHLKVKTNP